MLIQATIIKLSDTQSLPTPHHKPSKYKKKSFQQEMEWDNRVKGYKSDKDLYTFVEMSKNEVPFIGYFCQKSFLNDSSFDSQLSPDHQQVPMATVRLLMLL